MGRPSYGSRRCPNVDLRSGGTHSGGYDSFERLYVRRGKKMIPVGRLCAKCGEIKLDEKE